MLIFQEKICQFPSNSGRIETFQFVFPEERSAFDLFVGHEN